MSDEFDAYLALPEHERRLYRFRLIFTRLGGEPPPPLVRRVPRSRRTGVLACRDRLLATAQPRGTGSAAILERYATLYLNDERLCGVHLRHARLELHYAHGLVWLVSNVELTPSVEDFQFAADACDDEELRARVRVVCARLLRCLQRDGTLQTPAELALEQRIDAMLAVQPAPSRYRLRRWNRRRREQVGAHDRFYELRDLCKLERLACQRPDLPDAALVSIWIESRVRLVVGCAHPPGIRHADGSCPCGATEATHGLKPTPGERRQRAMRRNGLRYLEERRRG